ncbi:hypothetical protein B484DRAFT_440137, partial [Ochromonadaceae sp. CCMP2298]
DFAAVLGGTSFVHNNTPQVYGTGTEVDSDGESSDDETEAESDLEVGYSSSSTTSSSSSSSSTTSSCFSTTSSSTDSARPKTARKQYKRRSQAECSASPRVNGLDYFCKHARVPMKCIDCSCTDSSLLELDNIPRYGNDDAQNNNGHSAYYSRVFVSNAVHNTLFRVTDYEYSKREVRDGAGALFKLTDKGTLVRRLTDEEAAVYDGEGYTEYWTIRNAIRAGMLTDEELSSMALRCKTCHTGLEKSTRRTEASIQYDKRLNDKLSDTTDDAHGWSFETLVHAYMERTYGKAKEHGAKRLFPLLESAPENCRFHGFTDINDSLDAALTAIKVQPSNLP